MRSPKPAVAKSIDPTPNRSLIKAHPMPLPSPPKEPGFIPCNNALCSGNQTQQAATGKTKILDPRLKNNFCFPKQFHDNPSFTCPHITIVPPDLDDLTRSPSDAQSTAETSQPKTFPSSGRSFPTLEYSYCYRRETVPQYFPPPFCASFLHLVSVPQARPEPWAELASERETLLQSESVESLPF